MTKDEHDESDESVSLYVLNIEGEPDHDQLPDGGAIPWRAHCCYGDGIVYGSFGRRVSAFGFSTSAGFGPLWLWEE